MARLLDASIATIVDVGYARASAAVVTRRAGLSGGALFRHFETMGDFMAATAYEVMRRQLDDFGKQVAAIPLSQPALEAMLHILRDITGNDTNVVIYELLVAARTDDRLRVTLQEVLSEYSARILDTGPCPSHGRRISRGDSRDRRGPADQFVRRRRHRPPGPSPPRARSRAHSPARGAAFREGKSRCLIASTSSPIPGFSFPVTDEGPIDGDVVVLLHGFPQTSASLGRALHAIE